MSAVEICPRRWTREGEAGASFRDEEKLPRTFPNTKALERLNRTLDEKYRFREQNLSETDEDYRAAFADHMKPIDHMASLEIRTGGKREDMVGAVSEEFRKACREIRTGQDWRDFRDEVIVIQEKWGVQFTAPYHQLAINATYGLYGANPGELYEPVLVVGYPVEGVQTGDPC